MSFIGNLAAASSAKAIGKYNASVAYQEAQYERKKAAVKQKVYETVEKPRLLDQQDQQFSDFFVKSRILFSVFSIKEILGEGCFSSMLFLILSSNPIKTSKYLESNNVYQIKNMKSIAIGKIRYHILIFSQPIHCKKRTTYNTSLIESIQKDSRRSRIRFCKT